MMVAAGLMTRTLDAVMRPLNPPRNVASFVNRKYVQGCTLLFDDLN